MKNVSVNYQSLYGHLAVVKVLHDFCLKIDKYIHILWGTKLPRIYEIPLYMLTQSWVFQSAPENKAQV